MSDQPPPYPGVTFHPNLFRPARGERCLLDGCRGACCVNGIWVDLWHAQRILQNALTIQPFLAPEYQNPDEWFTTDELESDDFPSGLGISTAVGPRPGDPARQGCVFLRPDHTCGLQVASVSMGFGYPGLKPVDCAMYPLLVSEGVLQVDEQSPGNLGGADCQRECDGPKRPMYQVFREEIELAIGKDGWLEVDRAAGGR